MLSVALFVPAIAVAPAAQAGHLFAIKTANGKCLDVAGWSKADGARIIQWTCHYGANQLFTMRRVKNVDGAPVYALISAHSGKCVEVGGWSKTAGAKIIQWHCFRLDSGGHNNQLWWDKPGKYLGETRYKNVHSRMYLDVPSNHNWNNLQLQQWHYLSWSRAQDFREVVPAGLVNH